MKRKYRITASIKINAKKSKIYNVLINLENWHLWTNSIKKITYLPGHNFSNGNSATVFQPKLSPAIWTITEIVENESFTWKTKTMGVIITAEHNLKSNTNTTILELNVYYEGFWAGLVYILSKKMTSQYLAMEAKGFKNASEK